MDFAAKGSTALGASNYDEAIDLYSKAIAANPNAVDYYIKRSTAYQRSSKYTEALTDAEIAVVLAHKRAKRELIKDAQLRRGIALFFNQRYADAEHVFNIVKRLDEKEKMLAIWVTKTTKKLAEMEKEGQKQEVTVKDVPDVEIPSVEPKAPPKSSDTKEDAPAPAKTVAPTPASKIKHDWYQNNENVTFTLLAKGVPKDKATVEIEKESLSISFPVGDTGADYDYTLDPFYAPVDPTKSSFRITPTKIEVTLKKETPGVKWHSLEGERSATSSAPSEQKTTIPSHVLSDKPTNETAPAYPTSSKSGTKNWDKVIVDDLGAEDDFEGDETTRFFKQLYKDAGPEQQRAMMKSYQESGGTVLSTDWSSVGKKHVDPAPPEGMEAKKY